MERTRLVWLFCLPIAAIGGFVAHLAVYSLFVSGAGHAGHETHAHAAAAPAQGGAHLRACLAICGAILVVGLATAGTQALRRGRPFRVPLWTFAFLPPVVFVLQEQLEALAGGAAFSEPAFVVGLVLQVPFALVTYLVARAVFAAGRALVRCRSLPRPRLAPFTISWLPVAPGATALAPVLARGHGQRAPPPLSG
jgi:hypothetical protein